MAFPAFVLGNDPATTITLVCYSQELGEKMMRDLRNVMRSNWCRRVFPHTRLMKDTAGELVTTRNGGVNMTSINGTLTGCGSDIIIIDDPLKPDSAMFDAERTRTNQWLSNTLFSRLDDKAGERIVVAMQRLHEEDVTGYLTAKEDHRWTVLKVPAIAPEACQYRIGNVAGEELYERADGSVIDSDREDLATLDQIRRDQGSLIFSAQYQQEPIPREGNIVKREWFRWYDRPPDRSECRAVVMSWDTASEAKPHNDYSVGTVWGVIDAQYYLLDLYRGRLNYPNLRRKIRDLAAYHRAAVLLLEDADSGRHLKHDLDLPGVRILALLPRGSKEDRFSACSFLIERGQVFLPKEAPWLDVFMQELLGFPGTRYDDQVDSVEMFLRYMNHRRGQALRFDESGQPVRTRRQGRPRPWSRYGSD